MNFPRIIWMYWHQGFEQAPTLVKQCVISWKRLHPKWDIKLLDADTIENYIEPLALSVRKLNILGLAHRSDIIRTQLLIKHGGVWADPTTFPIKSLDDWLNDHMQAGLFLFYKPGRDRIISNWFIAAEKENPFLKKLLKELIDYWEGNTFINFENKPIWYEDFIKKLYSQSIFTTQLWFTYFTRSVLKIYPYMVYHYKFYQLISNDKQCKNIWKQMPKISADGPHKLQSVGLLKPLTEEIKEMINHNKTSLFKLTWRLKREKIPENSILAYLFTQNL